MRTKVNANNTVQKSMLSAVALQIGSFIMNMIRLGCLENTLVISLICFSSTAVVRTYGGDDAHVCIFNQDTGHHKWENLKQGYKFIINLVPAIKPSFHSYKLIIRTPTHLYFLTSSIITQQNIPSMYKDALMALSVLDLVVKFKWCR